MCPTWAEKLLDRGGNRTRDLWFTVVQYQQTSEVKYVRVCDMSLLNQVPLISAYTAKNQQLVAIFLGTRLSNVLLPTLLTVVNNNFQHCYTRRKSIVLHYEQQNIVQSCYTTGSEFWLYMYICISPYSRRLPRSPSCYSSHRGSEHHS